MILAKLTINITKVTKYTIHSTDCRLTRKLRFSRSYSFSENLMEQSEL